MVGDNILLVINCLGNIILLIDFGECFVIYSIFMFIVIDDCDDDLMVSCFLFGVIIVFIGFENELLKGVIIVICVMEDDKGNFVNCIYNIIVED